jgi:hypothetical protein
MKNTNVYYAVLLGTAPVHSFVLPKKKPNLYQSRNIFESQQENDYLITDSMDLKERPSALKGLSSPRNVLSVPLLSVGFIISAYNIFGVYDETYVHLEEIGITFGLMSTILYVFQIRYGIDISKNIRRGIVDDATVNAYAALYTCLVSWLALRTSAACPSWLSCIDVILSPASFLMFVLSFFFPVSTLIDVGPYQLMVSLVRGWQIDNEYIFCQDSSLRKLPPPLSSTELLRAQGLTAIGLLGCVFAPDALSFSLGGQDWWNRVCSLHPAQQTLESSTSLFALFATEASMVSHRLGKAGVATYAEIVPSFALVCAVLAIIPYVCAIYWLGDEVSFFSFYTD